MKRKSAPSSGEAAEMPPQPSSKYRKLDQRDHVLKRPGLYIGGIHPDAVDTWHYKDGEFRFGTVRYSPGFVQTFLEILTNAVDHAYRTRVTEIRVDIDRTAGEIVVRNDGDGICTRPTEEGIRGPELVFGHLLSSSNFDDDNTRMLAGQNGIGCKAANIFSKRFDVETLDSASKPKVLYRQTWSDNMSACGKPEIEKLSGKQKPYTKVTYKPDFDLFHMPEGIDDDTASILAKCVIDASAVTPTHTVLYLDGEKVPVKGFKDYCGLFCDKTNVAFDASADGVWEVAVACSPDGFRQVSFVNGLCTPRGGKHVDHVVTAVSKKLSARLTTKTKNVTNRLARNAMWIFVKASVPDPMFDSQNKHTLTTPAEKFKSRYEAGDNFVKSIVAKTGIADRISALGMVDDESKLKKTDGALKRNITGVPALDDAIRAGTKDGHKCTLYVTEGMSARSTAIAGLSVIGRETNGVWCVKGKCLNVRDASTAKIGANAELATLKKIVGLESGKKYATPEERRTLRYGSLCVLSDQDTDGYHIRFLIVNIFHTLWPELVRTGFVKCMNTPIVTVHKGKTALPFYNIPEFDRWNEQSGSGYSVRYRKGLGLATNDDARWFFREMKQVTYTCDKEAPTDEEAPPAVRVRFTVALGLVVVSLTVGDVPRSDDDAIDMAFRKARADDRKEWLKRYDRSAVLDGNATTVSLRDGVNRELAHFSHEDVARSLPSVVDGLKESQRKILYAAKNRSSAEEIRVAQMAAYVSQVSSYHHGEASLQGAIVGMAQTYVGTGSLQIMHDQGQFGSRLEGGKDAASSRYIHTRLTEAAKAMFPSADEPLLERALDDDRKPIEPIYFVPVLPVLLLNGSVGIATGWSTSVPCFSPDDVAEAYRARLLGDETALRSLSSAKPFYRGFKGEIELEDGKWYSKGIWKKTGLKTAEILELPVGTWTSPYKQFLEEMAANPKSGLKSIEPRYTESVIRFVLNFDSQASLSAADPWDAFKLRSDRCLSTSNMHALDPGNRVEKYADPGTVAETHFSIRYKLYQRRLEMQRNTAERDVRFAEAREGFVADVVARALDVTGEESVIHEHCERKGWPSDASHSGYDYLTNMPVSSLTRERHQRLVRDLEKKRERLREIMSMTAEGAWLEEIDAVLAAMKKASE
nr:DNA topoisomerase 2 [Oceanusvirus sp.]